jgi:hypothetical protein
MNNDNAIPWKYTRIGLRSSAVRQFSKSEQLHEDGQVGQKQVAADSDFNAILN